MRSDDGAPVRTANLPAGFTPAGLPALAISDEAAGITLYEFIDYNCGYCRSAASQITALLGRHKGLRLAIAQHPVLTKGSAESARLCLSAALTLGPHKAYALHQRLLEHKGRVDGSVALDHARALGYDVAQLEKHAGSPVVTTALELHTDAARQLRLKSVPSFVLANIAFIGWPGPGTIERLVADIRQCGQPFCTT